jgi:membrane associated rhomboid family serine protease
VAKLRITYNAPVVLTFTIAAIAAFIVLNVSPGSVKWFAAAPQIDGTQSYIGMFTHILGHASWEHLLGNFMLILLLGPILEERHGSFGLLVMVLITALVTGMANLAFSSHYLLGASGIVFMMILLASMANIRGGEIPLTFIAVAIIYMGGEIVKAFRADDGVSHMAHLVGGAAGAAFGIIGARVNRKPEVAAKKPADLTKLKLPI